MAPGPLLAVDNLAVRFPGEGRDVSVVAGISYETMSRAIPRQRTGRRGRPLWT